MLSPTPCGKGRTCPVPRRERLPWTMNLATMTFTSELGEVLTIHIVSIRFASIVIRHRQHVASRVRLGQRPVVVMGSMILNKGCWNAARFIDNSESLAVPSVLLLRVGQRVVASKEEGLIDCDR